MMYESKKVGYALVEIVAIWIIAFYKYPEVSILSIILLLLK